MRIGLWIYGGRYRYVILCLGFLCLTSICSNYLIITFTFICMAEDPTERVCAENGSFVDPLDYTPMEKSMIIWAVAVGTVVGTIPVNYSYIKFGARWPFFFSGMLSAVSTALTPIAAHSGFLYLLLIRFVQGLAYAADFAAIGMLCVRWAPLSQISTFIGTLTCFSTVAVILTDPGTAWLCGSSLGWRASYYLHATFGLVVFGMWLVFYKDDPHLHKSVSEKELSNIQRGKTQAHVERDSFVPYKEILKNHVILIIWLNAFVELTTLTLLIVYAPLYFHSVLGFDISSTGLLVSFMVCVHLPLKFGGGIVSDTMKYFSEIVKMKIFNSIAIGLSGVVCILIGLVPGYYSYTGVALFTADITLMGLNPGGFYKCATIVSRQYAHFVIATIQFMKCIALFTCPAMVALLVHDERSHEQWRYVFWINGVMLVLINVSLRYGGDFWLDIGNKDEKIQGKWETKVNFFFLTVATDEPAAFTLITKSSRGQDRVAEFEVRTN